MRDVIYRDDAIALINSGISLDTDADREYAMNMFKALPSVDVVPKHDVEIIIDEITKRTSSIEVEQGEWIYKGDYAICSKCGGSSGTQFDGVEPIPRVTPFCPHCGTRMKGAKYETD